MLWLQIQVQFSSYLARVAHLAEGPLTSASTAEGSQARLESLQEALARIDAFGAMAAGAIDEAQVNHDPRASIITLIYHSWDGGLPQHGMRSKDNDWTESVLMEQSRAELNDIGVLNCGSIRLMAARLARRLS